MQQKQSPTAISNSNKNNNNNNNNNRQTICKEERRRERELAQIKTAYKAEMQNTLMQIIKKTSL